jgi:hypothetical protein
MVEGKRVDNVNSVADKIEFRWWERHPSAEETQTVSSVGCFGVCMSEVFCHQGPRASVRMSMSTLKQSIDMLTRDLRKEATQPMYSVL